MRSLRLALALGAMAAPLAALPARGGPADPLLDLVPADAGLVLAIEDLAGQSRAFLGSPLAAELRGLPAVTAWMGSDAARRLERARREIEAALGVTLEQVRDDLLGEAVVLALHHGVDAPPEDARGLLLVRVRDRPLLDRLIDRINRIEADEGRLEGVESRDHRGAAYSLRRFRPGTKPVEAYAVLDGSTFAWSNSEELIRGVLDRHHRPQPDDGFGESDDLHAARAALPVRPLASLFVGRRLMERSLGHGADSDPARALAGRYLRAVRLVGVALEFRDGLFLHVHERIDPEALDEPLRRLATGAGEASEDLVGRIPPSAALRARGHVDTPALADMLLSIAREEDRPRIEAFLTTLRGVLLGKDVRGEVLPALGPGVVAYMDAPEVRDDGEAHLPLVVAVEVKGDPSAPMGVPAALDNALRTRMAMAILEGARLQLRVETREDRGVRVTALLGRSTPLAYALGPGFLVLGTSPESVASFAAAARGEGEGGDCPSNFERTRSASYPEARTFAHADLEVFLRLARAHREALIRQIAAGQGADTDDVGRDLDRALDLLSPFCAAFYTQRIAPDFTSVDRTFGLPARVRADADSRPDGPDGP